MNIKDFNKLVKEQLNKIESILIKKQKEYNLGIDRLSVFKQAAQLEQITPEQALLGFVTKQIISLYDMVNSKETYDQSIWNEKLIDIQAYMILLKALLLDTKRSDNEENWR